jgi:hypothetical protein
MALPLILFEAAVGGATYWIAALHIEHARELLYAESETMGHDDADDIDDATITECPLARAEKLNFKSDEPDEPASRSMWAEFLREDKPRVIACSEWP